MDINQFTPHLVRYQLLRAEQLEGRGGRCGCQPRQCAMRNSRRREKAPGPLRRCRKSILLSGLGGDPLICQPFCHRKCIFSPGVVAGGTRVRDWTDGWCSLHLHLENPSPSVVLVWSPRSKVEPLGPAGWETKSQGKPSVPHSGFFEPGPPLVLSCSLLAPDSGCSW